MGSEMCIRDSLSAVARFSDSYCIFFCVPRDQHLYIDRPVRPFIFSPCLLLLHASSAIPLPYFKLPHHNLTSTGSRGWWGQSPGSLASGRPPRAPSPPLPTSSPSSSVWLMCCSCSFSSPCTPAPHHPVCLLRLLLTAATLSLSRHPHRTWRWRALSSYATVASRR